MSDKSKIITNADWNTIIRKAKHQNKTLEELSSLIHQNHDQNYLASCRKLNSIEKDRFDILMAVLQVKDHNECLLPVIEVKPEHVVSSNNSRSQSSSKAHSANMSSNTSKPLHNADGNVSNDTKDIIGGLLHDVKDIRMLLERFVDANY